MPIYTYKCPNECSTVDKYMKTTDSPPTCTECGSEMQKIITSSYKIRMDDYANRPLGKRWT